MQKDDLIYVGIMLDIARQAVAKASRSTRQDFDDDENLRLALTHLIQMIGETARRLSPAFREQHPETPWHEIIGMRHRVVHDYLDIDYPEVWKVATQDLPVLITQLEPIAPPAP